MVLQLKMPPFPISDFYVCRLVFCKINLKKIMYHSKGKVLSLLPWVVYKKNKKNRGLCIDNSNTWHCLGSGFTARGKKLWYYKVNSAECRSKLLLVLSVWFCFPVSNYTNMLSLVSILQVCFQFSFASVMLNVQYLSYSHFLTSFCMFSLQLYCWCVWWYL